MTSLIVATNDYLRRVQEGRILSREEILELQSLITQHNRRYYLESDPIISDREYDILFQALLASEEGIGEVFADSPTNKFALLLSRQFQKGSHDERMISLGNTYNSQDLQDFDDRLSRFMDSDSPHPLSYTAEMKFDGLGISLLYVDGVLQRALTRGNGSQGEDVTANVLGLDSVPKMIPYASRIEIRGEIILPRSAFARLNAHRLHTGEKLFANPRNAASGTLRQLDTTQAKDRGLQFYAYTSELSKCDMGSTHYRDLMGVFSSWGFMISPYLREYESISDFISELDSLGVLREEFDFEIDGLVLKVSNLSYWSQLGYTAHHPRYAIAYKFPANEARTRLLGVEHSVSRTGVVTPVALLDPIELGGVTISRATLHNYDEVRTKDVRIGDYVFVKRAGEVIPDIVSALVSERDGSEQIIVQPEFCSSCGSSLKRDEGKVALYCSNYGNCPAQILGSLEIYVSKHAANIEGLGPKILEALLNQGYICDIASLYGLEKYREEIASLEGFGEKRRDNLLAEIDKSRILPLDRWLIALNIPLLGRTSARSLAGWISDILAPQQIMLAELLQGISRGEYDLELLSIDDVGPQTLDSLRGYLSTHMRLLMSLLQEVQVMVPEAKEKVGGALSGISYCVTGTFDGYSREEIHALILKHSGGVRTSVSQGLDFLIAGDKAGSKVAKAESLSVPVLSLEEFMRSIT